MPSATDAAGQGAVHGPRPAANASSRTLSIHWSRAIALGLNVLAWIIILAIAKRLLPN